METLLTLYAVSVVIAYCAIWYLTRSKNNYVLISMALTWPVMLIFFGIYLRRVRDYKRATMTGDEHGHALSHHF